MSLILDGTNGLSDVDGSASTPAIRGTDTNTGIFFPAADTIAFSEGGAEVARFDSSGNLGIGTSSPTARLHVNTGGTSNTMARFTSNGTYSTYILTSGVTSVFSADTDGTNAVQIRGGSNQIECYTNGSERMRIDSSGNLLVGATSFPASGLTNSTAYVFGIGTDQRASFNSTNGNNAVNINQAFPDTVSRGQIYFYRQSTFVGSIASTSSATFYNTSSDYRLKENIAPMTGALAKVALLKPCTYTWKSTGEASQGFIAHELAEVVPDAVTGEKDAVNEDGSIKPQGIDTSFLVATLTAAIQELKAELDSVKAELATLKA